MMRINYCKIVSIVRYSSDLKVQMSEIRKRCAKSNLRAHALEDLLGGGEGGLRIGPDHEGEGAGRGRVHTARHGRVHKLN
jgi:hypothetical protein